MASPDITLPEHAQPKPPAEKASKLNALPESPAKTLKAIEFRKEKTPQEEVGIRKKTEDEYKVFLNNYLTRISRAADKDPSLRNSDAAKMGIQLMERLTTDGKPDAAKIESFLTEEKGWVIATEAINEQTLLLNAVTGFVAETKPSSKPGELLEKAKIIIEGRRLLGWLGAPDNPLTAKFIKFKEGTGLFSSIKNDPDLKMYTKAITGIDLDDYETNPSYPSEKNPIRKITASKDNIAPEDIRQEALQNMQARRDFLTDLGIPLKLIDSLPEEHLLSSGLMDFAQTSLNWEQEIIAQFDPSITRSRGSLEFNNARREIMLRYISEIKINEAIKNPSTTKSGVEQRLAGIEQEKTRRTQEAENKIKTLEGEKETLTSEKATIDAYNAAKTTFQQGLENYRNEFGAAATAGRTIKQEIDLIAKKITDDTDPDSIVSKQNVLAARLEPDVQAATTAALTANTGAGISQKVRDNAQERAEQNVLNRFGRANERINAEKAELTQKLTRLKELETTIDTNQKTVDQNEDAIVGVAKEDLGVILNNFNTITGWTITETQLRSLSEDQLFSAINAINTADPTRGWPEKDNSNNANRQILIDAITEAKAKQAEQLDPAKSNRDTEYNAVISWGTPNITPEQLRTASISQLVTLVNNANAVDRTHGWNATINANPANVERLNKAIKEAKNRLVLRHNISIQERIKDLDSQVHTQTELVENIKKDIDKKRESFILTNAIQERQGEMYKKALKIPQESAKYTDISIVTNADTEYSQAERNAARPKAYYEMIDLLFDYRQGKKIDNDTLTREEYFKRIYEFLPPAKLLTLITEALELHGSVSVSNELVSSSNTKRVQAFIKIVNKLGEEAIAL